MKIMKLSMPVPSVAEVVSLPPPDLVALQASAEFQGACPASADLLIAEQKI